MTGTLATPSSTLKILLIEDDGLVREVLIEMLTLLGHSVLATGGGREGLARLETGDRVDLVLTGLNMPGMSGWEVVKAVRAQWPTLRVGLITGTPDLPRAQREPVDLVIEKPLRLKTLREALSRLRA